MLLPEAEPSGDQQTKMEEVVQQYNHKSNIFPKERVAYLGEVFVSKNLADQQSEVKNKPFTCKVRCFLNSKDILSGLNSTELRPSLAFGVPKH